MKLLIRHQALLVLTAGFVFFAYLGSSALFNDDESKNAACTAEMFRGGAWVVPTFNGELQTDVPILINWFMLAAFRLCGISELSARLPSAIMALGTILLTYHIGRKLFSTDIGFLAGIILATCLLFSATGRSATYDSTYVFFVTCSFTSYVWIVTRQRGANFCRTLQREAGTRVQKTILENQTESSAEDPPPKVPILKRIFTKSLCSVAPIYIPLGFAVIAYGPFAFILPCMVLVSFLLISKRLDDLENQTLQLPHGPRWRSWVVTLSQVIRPRKCLESCREIHLLAGIGIVVVIASPWYFAVATRTSGVWLREFLIDHHIGSAFNIKDNQNGFPFFQLYPLVVIHFGCFPWSVFLPVAVCRLWERLTEGAPWRESDRLLACWIGVWFLTYSLFSTKLPNSLLPIYPAVALVLARYFNDWKRGQESSGVYSFFICCRAMWISGAILTLGFYIAAYLYFPAEQWLGVIGIVPIAGALIAMKLLELEKRQQVLRTLVVTAVLLAILVVAVIPMKIRPYQDTPIFIAEARKISKSSDVIIGTYGYFEPSVVFYSENQVRLLKTPRQVADFLNGHAHGFVIAKVADFNELRGELFGGYGEVSRHRNFLRGRELILIGRN